MNRIPNFTELRAGKAGYDTRYQIDNQHPLYNDPLVDPRDVDFGFEDASSYYSKSKEINELKIPNAPLVRLDVAKRLVRADQYLRTDPDIIDALGSPAHIRIEDAFRPYLAQKFAHDIAWPAAIRKANPGISDEEIAKQLPNNIANPKDLLTPTPHLTGGAVDVRLINLETGEPFDRGHQSGGIKGTAYPDFYEDYQANTGQSDIEASVEEPISTVILLGRRILYFAMTEAGLQVNPTEIWHYGKGDPLSEYVSGTNHPYYGIADLPDWYKEEMERIQSK